MLPVVAAVAHPVMDLGDLFIAHTAVNHSVREGAAHSLIQALNLYNLLLLINLREVSNLGNGNNVRRVLTTIHNASVYSVTLGQVLFEALCINSLTGFSHLPCDIGTAVVPIFQMKMLGTER